MISINHLKDRGKKRDHNEDDCNSFSFAVENDLAYAMLLADGMGGHASGEVASKIFIETASHALKSLSVKNQARKDFVSIILDIFVQANENIVSTAEQENKKGMGCTGVIGIIHQNKFYGGWIGDSRIYLHRKKQLKQISKDHSLVQVLVDTGEITQEEAETHPDKNIITKAVGLDRKKNKASIVEYNVEPGDVFFLCSDGLNGEVTNLDMQKTINEYIEKKFSALSKSYKENLSFQMIANFLNTLNQDLISQANNNGGGDNISIVTAFESSTEKVKKVNDIKELLFSKNSIILFLTTILLMGMVYLGIKTFLLKKPNHPKSIKNNLNKEEKINKTKNRQFLIKLFQQLNDDKKELYEQVGSLRKILQKAYFKKINSNKESVRIYNIFKKNKDSKKSNILKKKADDAHKIALTKKRYYNNLKRKYVPLIKEYTDIVKNYKVFLEQMNFYVKENSQNQKYEKDIFDTIKTLKSDINDLSSDIDEKLYNSNSTNKSKTIKKQGISKKLKI